jgi:thiol-disulfide isomerase/thioredoxin
MQFLSDTVAYVNNLPPTKKLILIVIFFVVLIFAYDVITSAMRVKKVTDHSKEKMTDVLPTNNTSDSSADVESTDGNSKLIPYRDIMINTEVLNVTLFHADWCGHCKRFIGDTWGKLKEKFGSNKDVQLNQIDCTNVKSAIETPAGKSIEGFPSVILNYKDKDGKYVEEEYNGPRSVDVMSSVIDKFCGSSSPQK